MEALERTFEVLGNILGGIGTAVERGLTSVFGSSNARYLRRLQPKVAAINALESRYQALSDEELKHKTVEFRKRLAAGETLDDILVEAFAACREAGRRFIGMRHYDVQLIGGMVLHEGNIAEMITGEGKTLVATLPAYLNALEGRGVHVVTVNSYLARRDMEWMGPLYMGLGLTVDAIYAGMDPERRQRAYECDITYGTNNEFGFDYLRDNMKPAARGDDRYPKWQQQVQRGLNYAIIDEVDNILIDEARTPLIISGPAHDDVTRYAKADRIARMLRRDVHFEVKEKDHTVHLTEEGVRVAERLAGVESFYTAGNMDWPHLIDNALKAHHLYKLDVNYVVQGDEVVIVDEFTGRLMPGRNWSDGLHQAVEAKEGVRIKEETQTYATITLQNFFKLYRKICGMTGTAMTEATEFWKIYKLDVIAIPPNKPLRRINHPDVIYRSEREKFEAIVDEIERIHRFDTLLRKDGAMLVGTVRPQGDGSMEVELAETHERVFVPAEQVQEVQYRGRPILVGTVSIEKSERLSALLSRRGIPHQVLNAKHHEREAEIIAQAGRKGAVTIATNMAGRGTDIILGGNPETMAWAQLQHKYETRLDVPKDEWHALVAEIERREQMKAEGEEVKRLGGLHIIGTERHEARRIDLQLRGRSGRQGDPGSSRFYLSLEDDLMRIFAGEWVKNILTRLGMQEGEAIESRMVSRRIEGAQKKVEERNFEIRKNLLEYDEVMDEQRKRVYGFRQAILDGVNCKTRILEMIDAQIDRHLDEFLDKDYGPSSFAKWAGGELSAELDANDFFGLDFDSAQRIAREKAQYQAETALQDALDENLPEGEDESEYNWGAMAKMLASRWQLKYRDRDLKQIGRDQLVDTVLPEVHKFIDQVDLSSGARFLEPDYGLRQSCGWVHYKFGVRLNPEELAGLEAEAVKERVRAVARQVYREREIEYPVLAGLSHFTLRDASGAKRYDRERLIQWAQQRFGEAVDPQKLRSTSRDELRPYLLAVSRQWHAQAEREMAEAAAQGERLVGGQRADRQPLAEARLAELADWLSNGLKYRVCPAQLSERSRDELLGLVETAIEDYYHPEIRRMERLLVLQLLDSAWKDHLLAMDHLRSSVGLRGYAQVDPKVEYKREGMRTFEQMWNSIGERVTDLIFRMEQLDEGFVGATWVSSHAVHHEAPRLLDSEQTGEMAEAAAGSDTPAKPEPIRNRGKTTGRNDPCPCGSGKKFKNCCMRKGSPAG